MKKSFIYILLVLLAGSFVFGCAGTEEEREAPDFSHLVWPKPPEKPRIKYITTVMSDLDSREVTKQEKIFGLRMAWRFNKPSDVVVDKRGTAYVTDLASGFVAAFNLDDLTTQIHRVKVSTPLGIGYSEELDWLAVASPNQKTVLIYQLPEFKLKFGINSDSGVKLEHPVDIAIDAIRGRIYVSDSVAGYIHAYDLDGKYIEDIATPNEVFSPVYLSLDTAGNIYVVETYNFRFSVFTPEGETLTNIGEHGTSIGMFARPKGVALDNEDHIFVADAAFGNVQIFNLEGQVYLFFGTNGKRPGRFSIPQGMYVDHKDRLFIVDQGNSRVQVYQIFSDKYYEEHPEEAGEDGKPSTGTGRSSTTEPATEEVPVPIEEQFEVEEPVTEPAAEEAPVPIEEQFEAEPPVTEEPVTEPAAQEAIEEAPQTEEGQAIETPETEAPQAEEGPAEEAPQPDEEEAPQAVEETPAEAPAQ